MGLDRAAPARLRVESPFPAWAWPRVWRWMQEFRSRVADDFAPKTLEEFVAFQTARCGRQTWGVRKDGELCGMVAFEPQSPVAGTVHVTFRKDFWGRDVTLEALRVVAAEVFASGVQKICGCVFADNRAILSVTAALGAKREGLLRRHTMRGGKLVDLVVTGLLREDFEQWAASRTSSAGCLETKETTPTPA